MAAGKAAAEPAKRYAFPPVAIGGGLVVLVGALGFLYLERLSRQTPPGPAPLTGAAKAYVKNLRFVADDGVTPESPKMESHESYLKQTIVEITGNIRNAGDRALNTVEVSWIFYEPGTVMPDGRLYQETIWRERTFIVNKKSGGLDPGKARAFRVAFDNIPETWNQAMPNPVIAAIEFK